MTKPCSHPNCPMEVNNTSKGISVKHKQILTTQRSGTGHPVTGSEALRQLQVYRIWGQGWITQPDFQFHIRRHRVQLKTTTCPNMKGARYELLARCTSVVSSPASQRRLQPLPGGPDTYRIGDQYSENTVQGITTSGLPDLDPDLLNQ